MLAAMLVINWLKVRYHRVWLTRLRLSFCVRDCVYRIAGNIGGHSIWQFGRFSHYSGLKFDGMVQHCHTYMHAEKIWWILKAYCQTAKFSGFTVICIIVATPVVRPHVYLAS